TRLVPSDAPTVAPYVPDWSTGLQEALTLRPELVIAREEVKANQFNVELQKNSLLPDVRFFANYDINSLGNRLDGPGGPTNDNALRNLTDTNFHNWTLGVRGNVPIGFRQANATVRIARLNLARSYQILEQEELKIQRELSGTYQLLIERYESIKA